VAPATSLGRYGRVQPMRGTVPREYVRTQQDTVKCSPLRGTGRCLYSPLRGTLSNVARCAGPVFVQPAAREAWG